MRKVLDFIKANVKSFIVAIAAVAVLGVAVFDTYPTYLAKTGTLSPAECEQVAVLVAAHAYSAQNPGEAQPPAAKKILDESTRLAKRVAKYIIEKNPAIKDEAPMFVYMLLQNSCLQTNGQFELSK